VSFGNNVVARERIAFVSSATSRACFSIRLDDCVTNDESTPDAWGNDTFKFQLSGAETRREREEA
jgi:hypothetical protein